MFQKTDNAYQFKYLITAITGEGLREVYLPPVPADDKILFKKENKFVRPEMTDEMKGWVREMLYQRDRKNKSGELVNPDYIHPHQREINEWCEREWDRCANGIWFWNKGIPTYVTPFYYWYLSSWRTYFGIPAYRETDKEISYLLLYCEEDPDCYGLAFNTIRRYGKSVFMGAWATFRTTTSFNHFCGMQGETDEKIKKFYNKFIKKPFYKLPFYHQPSYNTDTKQTSQIEFDVPPKRSERRSNVDEDESLESVIEFRDSSEGAYDGDPLNTYLMEEPGKTKKTSIYNEDGEGRWDIVLPCLNDGLEIIGKAFLGTTVENLNVKDKGGAAYKRLFYDSDFNQKQPDGRTKSGLYACFLPGDCALKGFWDEWGYPKRDEARAKLMQRRQSFKSNPNKLAGHIRKYALSIKEIFYVNPSGCEFNATILQDRRDQIDMTTEPMWSRFNLRWQNNIRFGKVVATHDPSNGWLKAAWLPTDPAKEANLVEKKVVGGLESYNPKNDAKFAAGFDPIDHGVVVEGRSAMSEDGLQSSKRSMPVLFVKSKYDSSIDGLLDQDTLEARAQPGKMVNGVWELDENGQKYQYKTNRYVAMMDTRPFDPNILYERALLICWYFGVSLHVENQKPGVIRYFHKENCGNFILQKYIPVEETKKRNPFDEGTAASATIISEYTDALSTYIEYFGHTIPFRDLIEDLLLFNPKKTTEFDYSVAAGFTELACKIAPKVKTKPLAKIEDFMPMVDQFGNPMN